MVSVLTSAFRIPITSTLALRPSLKYTIAALFGLGVLRKVNDRLSALHLNAFTPNSHWDWKNKVVVLTGGSSGIGAKIAARLVESGAQIVILDIAPPKGKTADDVFFYQADISSSTKVEEIARTICEQHGNPTVLINNAGIGFGKTILNESNSEIQKIFDANVLAHFYLVKQFLPAMIEHNHGHIVTVASMASFVTMAQNELKHKYNAPRVRTSIVHPTWTQTPLVEKLVKDGSFNKFCLHPETVAEAIVSQLYSGRGGQLILPARLSLLSGVRGFPSWAQEIVRDSMANTLKPFDS
ncbi:uncharacterized protein BJX67DRAFT_375243 [Aspergillus lucknowensis]|uniref:NAD(P)-binding protein n=1 Tax=Aspergillus lucknowensis TaxID=176173 RepID=A0ABR4LD40_9EURO